MHAELTGKLRQLRTSSKNIPKKGKPPKLSSLHGDEFHKFLGICLMPAFLGFLYCIHQNITFFYTFHFVAQIILVMIAALSAKEFFKRLVSFKGVGSWIFHEANFFQKFSFSVIVSYTILWIVDIASPYLDNLWNQLHETLNHPESYSFFIHYEIAFYQQWLGIALIFTALIYFCAWCDKYSIRRIPTNSDFGLWLGESTGKLSKLSHGTGLAPKQDVTISLEDAAKNIIIMGGIGSGKTTRLVHPLLLQLVDQNCGGLIFDIKSNFHRVVTSAFQAVSKQHHLRIIGKDQESLNLIEGLTPEMVAAFLRASLLLNSNEPNEKFWLDTAGHLCANSLGVLSFFPKQYNLSTLHDYIFDDTFRIDINTQAEELIPSLTHEQAQLLKMYRDYHDKIFITFDERMTTGIKASVSQILSPFRHPVLSKIFCRDSDLQIQDVITGTTFLVDLPLAGWGRGGKVAYNLLKLRFFNLMKQRENRPDWNQKHPVFFMCDEYQEIVSGSNENSDLDFWDKSRSAKTIGIISTQSVSSFYAAIGNRDTVNALLQNFRQKIFFKTEDQATLDLLNNLTGTVDVPKQTISSQSGNSSGNSSHRSKTKTVTWVTKDVIDPQLIRTLEPHQAIAILNIHGHSCDDVINTMYVNS